MVSRSITETHNALMLVIYVRFRKENVLTGSPSQDHPGLCDCYQAPESACCSHPEASAGTASLQKRLP